MNCGFAIECYAAAGAAGLLDWIASLFTFNTVLTIWAGAIFGAQFRWPGVVAITFGLAALVQRKQSADMPLEVEDEDPKPVAKPRRKFPLGDIVERLGGKR